MPALDLNISESLHFLVVIQLLHFRSKPFDIIRERPFSFDCSCGDELEEKIQICVAKPFDFVTNFVFKWPTEKVTCEIFTH